MSDRRFDHVALEVDDLERFISLFSATGALHLIRMGMLNATGQRIAMLGDGTGARIELIENPKATAPTLAHLALRVDSADQARTDLMGLGWQHVRGPNELAAAGARSALLADRSGLQLQVIAYRADSPDLETGTRTDDRSPNLRGET
jgi:hypothetical protein